MTQIRDQMASAPLFREALNEGIASGTFVDTKFILFSRRSSSGRVYAPKALYANSHVLKSVPYFKDREPPAHHLDTATGRLTMLTCQFSLETFWKPDCGISMRTSTMMIPQLTMVTTLTATLKTTTRRRWAPWETP